MQSGRRFFFVRVFFESFALTISLFLSLSLTSVEMFFNGISIQAVFIRVNEDLYLVIIGLATKSLPPNDKIRNHLVANRIVTVQGIRKKINK